uniref:hypothetical protein n=1 Tax=uncultured Methanobrevibacter sp. TaxID=253161 RepID=UPI002627289A
NATVVLVATGENATGVDPDSVVVLDANGNPVTGITVTVQGNDTIIISGLIPGNYTVQYTNTVNETLYNTADNVTGVCVLKANSTIMAENQTVVYNATVVLVATGENATGVDPASIVVLDANGNPVTGITVTVNGYNIAISGLIPGNYTVQYTNTVNETLYNTADNVTGVCVLKANSTIQAPNQTVTYNASVILEFSIQNATGIDVGSIEIVNVDTNQTVTTAIINVDDLTVTISGLGAGNYTVKYNNTVNETLYNTANNVTGVTVLKAPSTVSAPDIIATFGDEVLIPVSSVNATGVTYEIIDSRGVSIANGTVGPEGPINASGLAAGDYTVKLTTEVDNNHTSFTNTSKIHIRHVYYIVLDPITGYTGQIVNITAHVTDETGSPVDGGTATLVINYDNKIGQAASIGKYGSKIGLAVSMGAILGANAETYTTDVHEGEAVFENVKLGAPGVYPDVATYEGDDGDPAQNESTVTILKLNTTVDGDDVSGKPADKKDITVDVLDQNNKPVKNGTATLTLNGKTYTATVKDGKAVFKNVVLPNPGDYVATVDYNGNDYYNPSSTTINVHVDKLNTQPSADDVTGKEGEKKDIVVKIVDENNNPVKNGTATLVIDGKSYTADVVDGVAIFKDVVLPADDTVAVVYYHGNDYYNDSTTTFLIKIEKNENNETNGTGKVVSEPTVDTRATGNPIAILLLALITLVSNRVYRKR